MTGAGAAVDLDDLTIGHVDTAGPYLVEETEMRAFAERWDPLPIHVDDAFAAASPHGGIIASGLYTLSVKQYLLARHVPWGPAVIGAAGYDELRFPHPVRAGDRLSFTCEVLGARRSRGKPDRGVITVAVTLRNQNGETVLSYRDTVIIRVR